jgi:LAO/AO transport system kinase
VFEASGWRPPIVSTVALRNEGTAVLWAEIQRHRGYLETGTRLAERRAARLTDELHKIMAARLLERAAHAVDDPAFAALRDEVLAHTIDPWTAADRLLGFD